MPSDCQKTKNKCRNIHVSIHTKTRYVWALVSSYEEKSYTLNIPQLLVTSRFLIKFHLRISLSFFLKLLIKNSLVLTFCSFCSPNYIKGGFVETTIKERGKKPKRCNNQMFIINFCLNMFRASLYPSSGEQIQCVTAYGVLRWFCWMWLVAVVGRRAL